MYQAGEFIVYGTNSVCRVESIGKPPFETEEDKLYYTLVPVTGTALFPFILQFSLPSFFPACQSSD